MVLCDICRGIPFDDAPPFPKEYTLPGLPDDDNPNADLFYVTLKDGYKPPVIFGYSHYQSLHDLKSSARDDGCGLCTLIYDEFHELWKAMDDRGSSWRFFITGREHKQQGFQVWTDGDRGTMLRVGAFGYLVKNDDDSLFSRVYRGRTVTRQASSSTCWDIVEDWIDSCNEKHDNCSPGPEDVELPTRLIRVGKDDNSLKIVETTGQYGSYVALSYTWGPQPPKGFPYRLTEANHATYNSNIDVNSTKLKNAKTIMDAIHMTRKLDIKYLWVDALCIEQAPLPLDPPTDDYNEEAPKMAQYYSNAYLTISAAASQDSSAGIYNDRNDSIPSDKYTFNHHNYVKDVSGKLTISPLSLDKENILMKYLLMADETISSRAWTLQERILSGRTLFYGTDQMYWECNEHFVSENGAIRVKGRMNTTDKHTRQISLWESGKRQDTKELWSVAIEEYSGRNMTNPRDKLIAIGGLASKFAPIFKDKYLAGLWEKTIIADLWWSPTEPFMKWSVAKNWSPSSSDYSAPSWSWAAHEFAPEYKAEGRIAPTGDNRAVDAEEVAVYKGHSIKRVTSGNSFGGIKAAKLQLNAPVLHLRIDQERTHISRRQFAFTWKSRELHYKSELDFAFSSMSEVSSLEIRALVLAKTDDDGPTEVVYLCLLITPVGSDDSYRRIGTIWIRETDLGRHAPDFDGLWWYLDKFV